MERGALVQCQQCRAQIQITSSSSHPVQNEPLASSTGISSRLDESFMLLEDVFSGKHAIGTFQHGGESVEESFVILQQHLGASRLGPGGISSQQSPHAQRFSLADRMQALARVLELASEENSIDFPLCSDCFADVQRELELHVEELEGECAAYAALDEQLKGEIETGKLAPMDERTFQRELKRAQDEVRAEEAKLSRLEASLAAAQARTARAEAANARLDAVEAQYWKAFNSVMLALRAAADFRDSLQQRVDATERSLAELRSIKVLHDIFHIWRDGPFGTISGLRLGSTPAITVEWWEINAAWGQSVLLLDTIARSVGVQFKSHKLEPRGSYPRIHDSRGAAELFGPANKIVCLSYDRAQVGFLACLKELAEALAIKGVTEEDAPFALKFPIEGDRIGGFSIRYGMSRDKAWTKALKYTLVNLHFCLKAATVLVDSRRALLTGHVVAALPREGPRRGAVAGTSRI